MYEAEQDNNVCDILLHDSAGSTGAVLRGKPTSTPIDQGRIQIALQHHVWIACSAHTAVVHIPLAFCMVVALAMVAIRHVADESLALHFVNALGDLSFLS